MKVVQEKNISGGSNPSLSVSRLEAESPKFSLVKLSSCLSTPLELTTLPRTCDHLIMSQMLFIFHNLLILR